MAKPRRTILEHLELVHTTSKCGRVAHCPPPARDENDEFSSEQFVPAADHELTTGPDGHLHFE